MDPPGSALTLGILLLTKKSITPKDYDKKNWQQIERHVRTGMKHWHPLLIGDYSLCVSMFWAHTL